MTDETTPLRNLLNKSGLPFQLAVESEIRRLGPQNGTTEVWREVPYSEGFIDVVARLGRMLLVFECKRSEKPWLFICDPQWSGPHTRCRLEWFNGRAPLPQVVTTEHSRVFCGEWNMVEGTDESSFCVIEKGSNHNMENMCREVIEGAHELLADEELARDEFAVAVPVIVTNAILHVCSMSPRDILWDSGALSEAHGNFTTTDMIRFRKSLVSSRSNMYDRSAMEMRHWTLDRERTVFVMNPTALGRFLMRIGSLTPWDAMHGAPKEFINPPKLP